MTAVEVTGAWLSAAPGHLIRVTDGVSERLAELQLTLGEGPSLDVTDSGGPVLASDLAAREYGRRWPAFAPAAVTAGAAAIFVFPLQIGAIRAGVLGLYRDQPGSLSTFQLGDALTFADAATMLMLDVFDGQVLDGSGLVLDDSGLVLDGSGPVRAARGAGLAAGLGPGGQASDLTLHRAEIDQATGMLTEQLGVGIADAFVRLRAYAYAHDLPLTDVARDIIARRLRMSPSSGPSQDGDA